MKVIVLKEQRALPDKSKSTELLDECEASITRTMEWIVETYGTDAIGNRGRVSREVVSPFIGDGYVEVQRSIEVLAAVKVPA